jgi:hypothetical protein
MAAKKASLPASKTPSMPEEIPALRAGQYSDGHPLDDVHYLESKIILRPDPFVSVKSFRDFAEIVADVASDCRVEFAPKTLATRTPTFREVVFLDTEDFRLYNNAFILRRRIEYEDGFPVGDPEIVFKFRHADMQKAAETDVRPHIPGAVRIKFKSEALPLRDRLGGIRLLFSHNAEFGFSQVTDDDRMAMATFVRLFPCLAALKTSDADRVELVNQTIVEEVLMDLGKLNFGKGVKAKCNVALWRERGDHRPLVGEFAFQAKFNRREDLQDKARRRSEKFFLGLQQAARDWVSLGTTKTGIVYRLKGNPPQSHE